MPNQSPHIHPEQEPEKPLERTSGKSLRDAYIQRKALAFMVLRLREHNHLTLKAIGQQIKPLTVRGGCGQERVRQLLAFALRLRAAGHEGIGPQERAAALRARVSSDAVPGEGR